MGFRSELHLATPGPSVSFFPFCFFFFFSPAIPWWVYWNVYIHSHVARFILNWAPIFLQLSHINLKHPLLLWKLHHGFNDNELPRFWCSKAAQPITFPPLWFTPGIRYFWWNAIFGFHQKYLPVMWPNNYFRLACPEYIVPEVMVLAFMSKLYSCPDILSEHILSFLLAHLPCRSNLCIFFLMEDSCTQTSLVVRGNNKWEWPWETQKRYCA